MMKKTIALILCIAMCISMVCILASCSAKDADYKGQYITMYISDNVYDLDPVNAYNNESVRNIVSLLFETLFKLDENGKVKKSLADDYKIIEDDEEGEYKMEITLAETYWSNNTAITADDVVFAWKRILETDASYEAAALLYDIRNARKVKEGEATIDDLGLYADGKLLTVEFEGKIDYDQFLLNLTSLALAPLNETTVKATDDWAKKPATMICSGAFKLSRISFVEDSGTTYIDSGYDKEIEVSAGEDSTETEKVFVSVDKPASFNSQLISSFIIERNSYYYRDIEKDDIDSSVTPYRILVDCSLSDEQIKQAYEDGQILYIGDIPLSMRGDYKDSKELTVKDSLSTHTYYLNQNAMIKKFGSEDGERLFAVKEVRQAMSMAIDRQAIADMVVFAEAATGIVPSGVFSSGSNKKTFREICEKNYSTLTKNMDKAKQLLDDANISPEDYTFSVTVAAYDEVHLAIAEQVVKAWGEDGLGFNVEIKQRGTIVNNDYFKNTNSIPTDICDDLYMKDLKSGDFEVIALDSVATAATAYAVLAPYAKAFSGQGMVLDFDPEQDEDFSYELTPHITGYDSDKYNDLMEKIFAEKTSKNRNDNLIEAEGILMDDMPAIPVVFNKQASLKSDSLNLKNKTLWWGKNTNYYTLTNFSKMTVKHYDEYLDTCADYLEANFDDFKNNRFSYFYTFTDYSFEEFKNETSNYSYLFQTVEE